MNTTTIGPLAAISNCAPDVVVPGLGFSLSCGGVFRNGGPRPLLINARSQPVGKPCGWGGSGAAVGVPITTMQVEELLPPKGIMTLPQPPTGQQWVVVFGAKRTFEDYGLVFLGVTGAVLGLAGVGLFDLGKMVFRHKGGRRR